jgi:hypothetical protein
MYIPFSVAYGCTVAVMVFCAALFGAGVGRKHKWHMAALALVCGAIIGASLAIGHF